MSKVIGLQAFGKHLREVCRPNEALINAVLAAEEFATNFERENYPVQSLTIPRIGSVNYGAIADTDRTKPFIETEWFVLCSGGSVYMQCETFFANGSHQTTKVLKVDLKTAVEMVSKSAYLAEDQKTQALVVLYFGSRNKTTRLEAMISELAANPNDPDRELMLDMKRQFISELDNHKDQFDWFVCTFQDIVAKAS